MPHSHPGLILFQAGLEGLLHLFLVFLVLHVNEINDDEAAQVPEAELPGHLFGGLQVGAVGRVFDLFLAEAAPGINVNGDQGLGGVDDNGTAGL